MRNLDPGDFSYDKQIAFLVSSCLAVCSCRSLEMGRIIAYHRLAGRDILGGPSVQRFLLGQDVFWQTR